MTLVLALFLALQSDYSTNLARQPATQPGESRYTGFEIPAVYRRNYAARYYGIEDTSAPSPVYVGPPPFYPPPMYYPPYPRGYYYPGFRNFFFAPAPFIGKHYFNPGPFFRPFGAPGQPMPSMRHHGGNRGGRRR